MHNHLSVLSPDDGRIQWLGTFSSAALEQAYRAKRQGDDLWLARLCVLAAIARILLCAILDYRALAANVFLFSLACRVAFVFLSVWALVSLRASDRFFFPWCLLLAIITTCFISLRIPTDTSHVYMTLATVLAAYVVAPLPLLPQMLAAIPFSIAVFGILMTTDRMGAISLGVAFVLANTVGIAISAQLQRRRRLSFLRNLRETELRTALQQALAEVKTLRGRIPICAWCKMIRDKDNAWQPVESFVRQHTHAEFSHGICPSCYQAEFARRTASSHSDNGV
jgi:hypothetical protein